MCLPLCPTEMHVNSPLKMIVVSSRLGNCRDWKVNELCWELSVNSMVGLFWLALH